MRDIGSRKHVRQPDRTRGDRRSALAASLTPHPLSLIVALWLALCAMTATAETHAQLSEAEARYVAGHAQEAWLSWRPRPDRPALFDQQSAFVAANDLVSFALGGNGSGKTACAAKKCADFVLSTPPPRRDTPFWILAEDYTQVCEVCWAEKLNGQKFLPDAVVDWERVDWLRPRQNWPLLVPLKKHANGNNWRLEFRSYAQGWKAQQARSIGGFWFSEQVQWSVLLEVLRGCREYMFPGGQFVEFTPLQPELCLRLEQLMEKPPIGWGFYRMNTELNTAISPEWKQTFFAAVPKEMLATRKTGALATFQGAIFPAFNVYVHVEAKTARIPDGVTHYRGIDWGFSASNTRSPASGAIATTSATCGSMPSIGASDTITARQHAKQILAISLAFGWPVPEEIFHATRENLRVRQGSYRTGRQDEPAAGRASRSTPRPAGRAIARASTARPTPTPAARTASCSATRWASPPAAARTRCYAASRRCSHSWKSTRPRASRGCSSTSAANI